MSNAKALMMQRSRPETVEIDVNGEKLKVDIRVPSMAQKAGIADLGGGVDAEGKPNSPKLFVAATLATCCFEHGTLSRLFSISDADDLAEAGAHIDALFSECMKRLSPDPESIKGKSEATSS